jgi:hypothetical protein
MIPHLHVAPVAWPGFTREGTRNPAAGHAAPGWRLLCAVPAGAQDELPVLSRDASGGYIVRATRVSAPIRIDGHLDDAPYLSMPPITELQQQEPRAGEPITEHTEIWVLFDDENLYFACRCLDSRPDRIISNEMRRDSTSQRFHDNFAVILDTFHDRRNGFIFTLTPIGGFSDGSVTDERQYAADWNAVWASATTRTGEGWFGEMAIPFRSLRYNPGREQTWGINPAVARSAEQLPYRSAERRPDRRHLHAKPRSADGRISDRRRSRRSASTRRARRRCSPMFASGGSIGLEASCSSCTRRGGTRCALDHCRWRRARWRSR